MREPESDEETQDFAHEVKHNRWIKVKLKMKVTLLSKHLYLCSAHAILHCLSEERVS